MDCPKCGRENFYFNVYKRRGFCHHATCNWSPNLRGLVSVLGPLYCPKGTPAYLKLDLDPQKPIQRVQVDAPPIVFFNHGLKTKDPSAVEALAFRNLTPKDIYKFNLRSTYNTIQIPIYEAGECVQLIKRTIKRSADPDMWFSTPTALKRYIYEKGNPITNYFLGWEECKLWDELVLVENTFNAIWLRDHLNCTTNFGSHLSEVQINKLINSNIKSVKIMWDAGAEIAAEKAVKRLRRAGIRASMIRLPKGQPDDYSLEKLRKFIGESDVQERPILPE
jgi:hypothetical protein